MIGIELSVGSGSRSTDSLQKAMRHKGKGLVRLFHTATRLKILFWRGSRA